VDAILPAASEPVMVFGGAVAAGAFAAEVRFLGIDVPDGFWSWFAIGLAGTVGAVLGSILGWWIGYRGGRAFVERHGRWVHVTPEKLERAERSFERWGDWFVAVGRVTPVLRSFVAIPAGVLEMPLRRYTILTIPGSAIWCFGLAGIGWALGANWERFHHAFHYVDYVVLDFRRVGNIDSAAFEMLVELQEHLRVQHIREQFFVCRLPAGLLFQACHRRGEIRRPGEEDGLRARLAFAE